MYMDPAIRVLVVLTLTIVVVGLLLKKLRQPHVVAYIVVGSLLGPTGFGVVTDVPLITRVGAFGVLLLVFFVGMELPLHSLVARWRVPIIGTALEVVFSIACVLPLGLALDWSSKRIVFFGFLISMSSTAVILNILRQRSQCDHPLGRDVTGITVAQDLAVVPMLVILGLLTGDRPHAGELALQVLGAVLIFTLLAYITRKGQIRIPLLDRLSDDSELQVFAALFVCSTLALITGWMHLSAALGAFVAGIVLTAGKHAHWVREHLEPFRVVLVGLFFISIGMLIDVRFLVDNLAVILTLVAVVFAANTLINSAVLRAAGHTWRPSIYGGALLSQIGEFSFVLAAIGLQSAIITPYAYSTAMAVICLTLLLSPVWVSTVGALLGRRALADSLKAGEPTPAPP